MCHFHPLEIVSRGSETQLQVLKGVESDVGIFKGVQSMCDILPQFQRLIWRPKYK